MWLLDTTTFDVHEFLGEKMVPPYAILSHTWGKEEVTFRDMQSSDRSGAEAKQGFAKIKGCCEQAVRDGLSWAWVDSCCIDKSSSAEVAEAINAMHRWYERSKVCYAYLGDVPHDGLLSHKDDSDDDFSKSRWFTRGWTLQELIAPDKVVFFAHDWTALGEKHDAALVKKISKITGITASVLVNPSPLDRFSVACRMSWASKRVTTREEDAAYCLLGLFDVSMPILYGEGGQKAFRRLQLEIIKESPDHSIFAWALQSAEEDHRRSLGYMSLLATSVAQFASCGEIQHYPNPNRMPFSMSNVGLSITLPMLRVDRTSKLYVAMLDCYSKRKGKPLQAVGIFLTPRSDDEGLSNARFWKRMHSHRLFYYDEKESGSVASIKMREIVSVESWKQTLLTDRPLM